MKSKILRGIALVFMAGGLLTGCASTAHIEKVEGVDMSKYSNYSWIRSSSEQKLQSPVSNASIMETKLRKAIGKQLEKQGWKESHRNPDVLISFDIVVEHTQRESSQAVYSPGMTRFLYNPRSSRWVPIYFPSRYLGEDRYTVPVKEGTLTVTMVDAQTEKVIWQGWTTSEVDNRNLTQKEIDKIVGAIFKKADLTK